MNPDLRTLFMLDVFMSANIIIEQKEILTISLSSLSKCIDAIDTSRSALLVKLEWASGWAEEAPCSNIS